MTSPNMASKRGGFLKFPSSVFFNLFALAIFLAVVIVLHQVLKKPELSAPTKKQEQITQATVDLPEPEVVDAAQPAVEKNVVKAEAVAPTKKKKLATKPKPVAKQKVAKKKVAKKHRKKYARKQLAPEPSFEELDNEQARQQYLQETYQKSPGLKPAAASSKDTRYSSSSKQGMVYKPANHGIGVEALDNEAARAHYQEQNRRLSKELVYAD